MFERKILKVGDSLGITLPDIIVKTYDLKKGTKIYLIADGLEDVDGFLLIDIMGRNINELWTMMKK